MTPTQVNKRLPLVSIMPGSKITPPSSHCIVVVLLVVGFIPLAETHNVTPLSFTDEWKNAMLSLGVDSSNFQQQMTNYPLFHTGVWQNCFSNKKMHLLIVRVGIFKIYAYYLPLFHPSLLPTLSHSTPSLFSLSLSPLHPLLLSLSCSLAPPLSLCSK